MVQRTPVTGRTLFFFRIDRLSLLCVVALHNVKIKIPRFSRNLETDFVKMLC